MQDEENFQNASEVASGTFWGMVGSGALKLISFLYVIYIARAISQNDIGVFYLAFAIIGLFGAWKTLGLPAAMGRYIPFFEARGEQGKVRSLFNYSLAINAAVGALLAAFVWLAAGAIGQFYQNPALSEALQLLASYIFLDNIFSTASGFLQGRADIKSVQLVTNTQMLFKFALVVIITQLYGASFTTLCYSLVLSYLPAILLSAKLAYNHLSGIKKENGAVTAVELAREIAPFGIMLTLISILWTTVSYSDRVILGFYLPASQANDLLAIYSMAVVLALNVMVFPGTVGGIFLPTISRLVGKEDHEGVRKSIATAQRWMLFITLPFAIVMIVFASEMLSVFYGELYRSGGMVMAIFCIGLLFSVFSYALSLALAGMRLVALEFKIAIVVVVANIGLCFLFIPVFGMEGAAMASAASFAVSAALFSHYGWKMIKYKAPFEIYKIFLAALFVCCLLFTIKPLVASAAGAIPQVGGPDIRPYVAKIAYLLLLGIVSIFSFFAVGALSLFAKCFENEDIAVMKQAARRVHMPHGLLLFAENLMLLGVSRKKGD